MAARIGRLTRRSAMIASFLAVSGSAAAQGPDRTAPGVAVMVVDTDHRLGTIDPRIYGQFLEHINHSVVDGLYAEQIRGGGFEGEDFKTYWEPFAERGQIEIANVDFKSGKKSV